MCIRDSTATYFRNNLIKDNWLGTRLIVPPSSGIRVVQGACLLYTSDAADDLLCVDLGGRRIIKKKKKQE